MDLLAKNSTNEKTKHLTLVERRLAVLSSAKSPDFVVLEARLLPCISKIKYGKQELSPRWRGSVNRDKTKGNLSELGFSR